MLDGFHTDVALEQPWLRGVGETCRAEGSAAVRVLNVACNQRDTEITVRTLPAVGLWVLVGKKTLAEDAVQEPDVGTFKGSFCAVIKGYRDVYGRQGGTMRAKNPT
jgi:hypothetical protein